MLFMGQDTSGRLKGKAVLVTGSITGIGEGIARVFASQGALVIVHGIEESAAQQIVAGIEAAGGTAAYVVGDLADPTSCSRIVREAIKHFDRLDALVNNAADKTRDNIESTSSELFDRIIAVNLRAPFLLIQAAIPQFRKQGHGRVLNIGSINAYCGERELFSYSISKGGLMTLTRNIADAYGSEGIRINQLNVGWTLTPNEYELKRKEGLPDDWPAKVPKISAPSGRLLSPEDVAWAAVYFISDEAALVNGAVVDLEQFPLIGRNPAKVM
jgi:NAD(P)-dependent dehydrogenase (short-subunit alcohol dehydrogenase family)